MDEGLLSNARPISCSDCPAFQRRHSSLFCTAESPNRLPGLMPHHLWRENLYQMVLHRPIETTNLPTEVRGIASTKTKASGSCHLAKDFARKERNSSAVARKPSFSTMAASGRSCHFGWGMPTTHASLTAG